MVGEICKYLLEKIATAGDNKSLKSCELGGVCEKSTGWPLSVCDGRKWGAPRSQNGKPHFVILWTRSSAATWRTILSKEWTI